MKVTTRQTNKAGAQIAVYDVNPGASLKEAIDLYGETLVYGIYVAEFVLKAHAKARGLMSDRKNKNKDIVAEGLSGEATAKQMVSFKPTLGQTKKSAVDRIKTDVAKGNMSKDQLADLIKSLKEQLSTAK